MTMIDPHLGYDTDADWGLIPQYMQGGLRRYLTQGIAPGSFMEAVLSNDLMGALKRGDATNMHALPSYGAFFYNYVDSDAYGSPENYRDWITHRGAAGREAMKPRQE
jgi:hypothetical protein